MMTTEERKERRKETVRRYRAKHKEAFQARQNRWRDKNRERLNEMASLWAKNNRSRINERQRLRRAANPEKARRLNRLRSINPKSRRTLATRRYLKFYGLTREELNVLQISSNGCCDLCGQQDRNTRRTELHVDHDHKAGKVRGLLCYKCNVEIGRFENFIRNRDWIMRIGRYLSNFEEAYIYFPGQLKKELYRD